jgi:hypothetical protein
LFERKFVVFCDGLFANKEIAEAVLPRMKMIGESDNVFIFLEG